MSLKILLVDDDEMILFLHKMVIEMSGQSVETTNFENGKKVFDYLNSNYSVTENYLILLDINMPEMDGWGFLDAIQAMPYAFTIKVVMVSSSIDIADRNKAMQYRQVIDYIEKPLDDEMWARIIKLPQLSGILK